MQSTKAPIDIRFSTTMLWVSTASAFILDCSGTLKEGCRPPLGSAAMKEGCKAGSTPEVGTGPLRLI